MKKIIEIFICATMLFVCLNGEAYAKCSKPLQGPTGPTGPTGPSGSTTCTIAPSTVGIPDFDAFTDVDMYYDISQFFTIGTGDLLRYVITEITSSQGSVRIQPRSFILIQLQV